MQLGSCDMYLAGFVWAGMAWSKPQERLVALTAVASEWHWELEAHTATEFSKNVE